MKNTKKIKKKNIKKSITNKHLLTQFYNKYKLSNIPIECIIQICLLIKGIRKIIQFDNLDESKFYSHEYQIIPNYKKLLGIFKKTLSLYAYKII